jgi:hypothetical protein
LLTPASAQSEGARQAGAEAINGDDFYRFKIGDFQVTAIFGWLWADTGPADLRYERLSRAYELHWRTISISNALRHII